MTRWQGNSGRAERLPEGAKENRPLGEAEARRVEGRARGGAARRPGAGFPLPGLDLSRLETEDLLLALILYLLYRESGDRDFLLMLAGTLLG